MLKLITVIVICCFGKLENNKSSIFGPATIYPRPATTYPRHATIYPRHATRDTRRLDYLVVSLSYAVKSYRVNPRRRRERERHQTKGLMSKTIAVHVHFETLYISLSSSAKQQREMTKFYIFWRTWTAMANFCIFFRNWTLWVHV